MPKLWTEPNVENPYYLRFFDNEERGRQVLCIVDANGDRVNLGNILFIRNDGTIYLPGCIDQNAAKRAGIQIDSYGKIRQSEV